MKAFNVEIFDRNLRYKSSGQVSEIKYSFDYLDIEKNKLKMPKVKVSKEDYLRITRDSFVVCGIVSDVVTKKEGIEISFKPFHKIFDVDMYMDPAQYNNSTMENMVRDLVEKCYVKNDDSFQNIPGLEVEIKSATKGMVEGEEGIRNLYDIILNMFTSYGIICDFSIDPNRHKVILKIGGGVPKEFVIEADRENIIDKEITIKEAKESTNKLTIYNQEDYSQCVTFYRDQNDNISTETTERVLPVVFSCSQVKVSKNTTFEEQALKKATNTLKPRKYNNLIEIEVLSGDKIVRPLERVIGQEASIISNGNIYETVLTGMNIEENVTLIFGAIRLELTKQLKRRWRKDEY